MDKRLRKYDALSKEVLPPTLDGNAKSKTILVSWGSNYGVALETARELDFGSLHFQQVWPFPKDDFLRMTKNAQNIIVIENNATGQLARIIKSQTGLTNISSINKYNGLPFTTDEITTKVTKATKN